MSGAVNDETPVADADTRATTGILLAGGLSRRFGSPKAFARLEGTDKRMFYERASDALRGTCDSVVLVTNRDLEKRFPPDLEVCTDLPGIEGQGPLAGICTAMRRRPGGRYIVMACDMPRIGSSEISRLHALTRYEAAADVIAVRAPDTSIPLLSVWTRDLSDTLEEAIRDKRLSVMKMLDQVETRWIDSAMIHTNERLFRNYNTPDAAESRKEEGP